MSKQKFVGLLLSLILSVFPSLTFAQTPPTISLNPTVTYQTFTGWEATAQARELIESDTLGVSKVEPTYALYVDHLMDQAVNDLGINRLRLEIKPWTENTTDYYTQYKNGQINATNDYDCYIGSSINDNADPNVINPAGFLWTQLDDKIEKIVLPMKAKVDARGEKLYINLNYVGFNKFAQTRCAGHPGLTNFLNSNPQEYAEFVLAAYQHMQTKYSIVPDTLEVSLEPDNINMTGTTMGNMIVATASRLRANGFTPNFIAPSTTSMNRASSWFDQIKAVPGALQDISEISYHRYLDVTDANLQNIATRAIQNNKNTSMLEWIGADYNVLHKDLTIGRNSAWQQFTLAWGDPVAPNLNAGGSYYQIDTRQTNPAQIVNMTNYTKFLRQYFKYIRSGAVRIEATTTNPSFDPVAFVNNNGKNVVVVKATAAGSFSVGNLPAGTYGVFYTTSSQYNINNADQVISDGGTLSTSIPAAGVLTIYAKTVAALPSASPTKPGDIDGNNKVDIFDYNMLLTDFGKTAANLPADIDKSGKVDIFDYNILLTNFGK